MNKYSRQSFLKLLAIFLYFSPFIVRANSESVWEIPTEEYQENIQTVQDAQNLNDPEQENEFKWEFPLNELKKSPAVDPKLEEMQEIKWDQSQDPILNEPATDPSIPITKEQMQFHSDSAFQKTSFEEPFFIDWEAEKESSDEASIKKENDFDIKICDFQEIEQNWNKVCNFDCQCGCKEGKPCTCGQYQEVQTNPSHKVCNFDCQCGCKEGKECTCGQYQEEQTNPSHQVCNFDCQCGCKEGKECTCGQYQEEQTNPSHQICNFDCQCGCKEGKECTCGQKQQEELCYYEPVFTEPVIEFCSDYCAYLSYVDDCFSDQSFALTHCLRGIWLPEDPVLFAPLVADPRQVCYSVGWRFNDDALSKNIIDISFGDSIAIYRWYKLWWGLPGQLQIDLEGALWGVFDPITYSAPLINADYYVGGVLTWAYCHWSLRLRGFHISSHIGDEFLLNHPGFDRRNPSAEYLDLFVSNWITRDIRLYAGAGVVVQQDTSFKCGRFYGEAGLEVHFSELAYYSYCNRLIIQPFFGIDFRFKKDFKHHVDSTYVLGYEWLKTSGLQRKVRLFMEYHDGYSLEGQFCRHPSSYFSIRMSYGF